MSLAWYLAIFEESLSTAGAHPGLLMIDSPQKNLIAATGQIADDYRAPAIALGVYEHIVAWCSGTVGAQHQVIVVDNEPPSIADEFVMIRYSGDAAIPPYGLIDDAIE